MPPRPLGVAAIDNDRDGHHEHLPLKCAELGQIAAEALRQERDWRIAAVHNHSAYVRSANGQFVCLGLTHIGRGPLNVLVELPENLNWHGLCLRVGLACRMDQSFQIAGYVGISFAGASVWHPDLIVPACSDVIAERLAELSALVQVISGEGPLELIHDLITRTNLDGAALPHSLAAIRRGVVALSLWAANNVDPLDLPSNPPGDVEDLIGLGIGLTPSGDDALIGALLALRAIRADIAFGTLAAWILDRASRRTNGISLAHIECAYAGLASEALHECVAALCDRKGLGAMAAIESIANYGHTSGWDALAGVVAVLSALGQSALPIRASSLPTVRPSSTLPIQPRSCCVRRRGCRRPG
jgi:hypothetical protein